jgi:Tol biopolymer transport system component
MSLTRKLNLALVALLLTGCALAALPRLRTAQAHAVGLIASFSPAELPANDDFANAELIAGNAGSVTGTNAGATLEAGEPEHVDVTFGSSVWYKWQAPAENVAVTFDTFGSSPDTVIAIYTGSSLGDLAQVANNNDADDNNLASRAPFHAVANQTYYIAVANYFDDPGASLVLSWSATPEPVFAQTASSRLVFERQRQIYTVNTDGTSPINLSRNTADERAPSWTPDATKILFNSTRDGNGLNIYRMNPDGSDAQIVGPPGKGPVLSPDGTRIAYIGSGAPEGIEALYVMNADGTNLVRLTDTPDESDNFPVWSPDSTRVSFSSHRQESNDSFVRTINADGTNLVTISPPGSHNDFPAWSPDGARVSFLRRTYDDLGNNTSANVYVVNADGSNPVRFDNAANEWDGAAVWSPDGARLAFLRANSSPSQMADLYTIRPDGSDLRRLTTGQMAFEGSIIQWSPDGSKLSFASVHENVQELDVINADGSGLVTVISSTNFLSGAEKWSPDGSKLVYQTCIGECESAGIYIVNVDGTNRYQLGDERERNFFADWSPDGTRLAFESSRNGVSSIDIINADGTGRVDVTNQQGIYSRPKWRPRPQQNTPAGANVTVTENGVTLTFSSVTTAGQTTVTLVDPNSLSGIPGEYVINGNSLAFEITTTAAYTGPITIGFHVPGVNDSAAFDALRVLHGEPPPSPNFVDRTILAPDTPSHDFPARKVYARVTSLSPFVVAERAPTDTTPPGIQITQPVDAVYLLRQPVAVSYSCTDSGGSGLAQCSGPVTSGALLDTGAVGSFSFTINARDHAGNMSARTVNYRVAYGVRALFDQTKAHKSGSNIPIKLELVDAAGVNQSASNVVVTATSVVRVSDDSSGALQSPGDSNPNFNFRYQSGGYHFNLKTTGYASGTYRLSFRAGNDGVSHTVQFKVK